MVISVSKRLVTNNHICIIRNRHHIHLYHKGVRMTKEYQTLADCIRSGQVSRDKIHEHFESDPAFKKWYKKKYLSQMQDSQENPYIGEDTYSIPDKIS